MSKSRSVLVQLAAYSMAIVVSILTWNLLPNLDNLWRLAVADLAATGFIFVCSVVMNNSSMYDPYWSVKPAVIATGYAVLFGLNSVAAIAMFLLMMLYNLRLTSNFLRDWPGLKHEDWRYQDFRKKFPKLYWLISLSGIHLFPTVMVYLACVPLYFGMNNEFQLNWIGVLGIAITLLAIVIAYVADEQMRTFRANAENKGTNMNIGLWRHSRHPNYFGELLTWWGIFLVALNADMNLWWTGVGALSITLMFVFISIPMMDKRSLQRRPDFQAYMDKTRAILPIPK
jgi:steroid 5-alpha reductase family enzyme